MSSRYDRAAVLTLKRTVSPRLTLMSVAKPWIDVLPAPVTSHVERGVPGFVFSQAIGFVTGCAHGSAASASPEPPRRAAVRVPAARTAAATRTIASRRRSCLVAGGASARPSLPEADSGNMPNNGRRTAPLPPAAAVLAGLVRISAGAASDGRIADRRRRAESAASTG